MHPTHDKCPQSQALYAENHWKNHSGTLSQSSSFVLNIWVRFAVGQLSSHERPGLETYHERPIKIRTRGLQIILIGKVVAQIIYHKNAHKDMTLQRRPVSS